MARVFTTGGEENDPVSVWDIITLADPLVLTADMQDLEVLPGKPRTGWACYVANVDNKYFVKNLANPDEVYVGFALYTGNIYRNDRYVVTLNPSLNIRVQTSTSLRFFRGSTQIGSDVSWTQNAWHYLEIRYKPRNTGGVVQVKLDGTLVLDYSGDTTDGVETVTDLRLAGLSSGNLVLYDDVVINDVSGSVNNSWPGQVRLLPLQPRAAGDTSQWDRAGVDLGSNLGNVRNAARGYFALLQNGTAEEDELFVMDAPDLPAGAVIKNVIAKTTARVQSGSGGLALLCKNGGNLSAGATQALNAGWRSFEQVFDLNPADSAAWEEADLANVQLGFRSKA